MNGRALAVFIILVLASKVNSGEAWAQSQRAETNSPLSIEPEELTKHPEWIGPLLLVDDRVALFQWHPKTFIDEIFLKRCPDVTFVLPPKLRMAKSPQSPAVKVRGRLRQEGSRWIFDVSGLELLGTDLERLNKAVVLIPVTETEKRTAWAIWAEKRAKAFDDEPLLARALEIESQSIREEAEKPKGDHFAYWMELAERARARKIPEPDPSAIARRAFVKALETTSTPRDLRLLLDRYEVFFPEAKSKVGNAPEASSVAPSPADSKLATESYRTSSNDTREGLDHQLWADLAEKWLFQRSLDEPGALLTLAEEAASMLPERPKLTASLLERGLQKGIENVANLRESEVTNLVNLYRDRLHQPEKGLALYRLWLDDQRQHRLSPRDAEGRIALAQQYESLLNDKTTAISLLREAWKIDPNATEIEEAFLRRRFQKRNEEWVESSETESGLGKSEKTNSNSGEQTNDVQVVQPEIAHSDRLKNASSDEVRARMSGLPNRRIRSQSQGQVVEQWIYFGQSENFYINLRQRAGERQPRVISFFGLPRSKNDPKTAP